MTKLEAILQEFGIQFAPILKREGLLAKPMEEWLKDSLISCVNAKLDEATKALSDASSEFTEDLDVLDAKDLIESLKYK